MIIDEIKYVKGRKTIGIHIKDGRVLVRAPRGIQKSKLDSALRDKEGWINKKLVEYRASAELNKDITEYKRFLFLGIKYGLDEAGFPLSGICRRILQKNSLKTHCGRGDCESAGCGLKPSDLKRIEREYKKQAAAFLPEFLHRISAVTGLGYNSVKLTRSKAKWGSCNDKGVITLNWRLIMLPHEIIEYVALHELCHLKKMDHSKEYWQTLEKYYPDVKAAKQYLKTNNFIIKLF